MYSRNDLLYSHLNSQWTLIYYLNMLHETWSWRKSSIQSGYSGTTFWLSQTTTGNSLWWRGPHCNTNLHYRVGQSVKPMTKAKISTHKGTAEQTFGPFHVSIYANDQSDISESIIMEKVCYTCTARKICQVNLHFSKWLWP